MGLSQGEFARCIGIGQVSVSQYERGDREPSLSKLKQIAERLGVSADWLLGLTDERTPPRGGTHHTATNSPGAVVGDGNAVSPDAAALADLQRRVAALERRR